MQNLVDTRGREPWKASPQPQAQPGLWHIKFCLIGIKAQSHSLVWEECEKLYISWNPLSHSKWCWQGWDYTVELHVMSTFRIAPPPHPPRACCFVFLLVLWFVGIGSFMAQAGLYLINVGIIGVHHHTQLEAGIFFFNSAKRELWFIVHELNLATSENRISPEYHRCWAEG